MQEVLLLVAHRRDEKDVELRQPFRMVVAEYGYAKTK
jgi:hypothetical protein